ncbi:MAG: TGS domain-containing protein, partial [Candidatus Bathyarchaeia archaeon]
KPAIIIANKLDVNNAYENLKNLEEHVGGKLPIIAVSCKNGRGLNEIGRMLFENLDIIRVYTKEPNEKDFSKKPFVLRRGSTVYDLAKNIHSDLVENFAYAKIWSRRLAFSPQKVGASFQLEDGDIVEIHTK